MYLHIGQGTVIRQQDIVGIFDLDNTTISKNTREFLAVAEKKKTVSVVSLDLPKTFIVCHKGEKNSKDVGTGHLYITPIAPRTLKKRAETVDELFSDNKTYNNL